MIIKNFFKGKSKLRIIILGFAIIIFSTIATVAVGCQVGKLINDYEWPDLEKNGYMYGGAACAVSRLGAFNYTIYKKDATTGDKAFCCTQNGCREIEIKDYGSFDVNCPASTNLDKTACKCKELAGLKDYHWKSYSGDVNQKGCN